MEGPYNILCVFENRHSNYQIDQFKRITHARSQSRMPKVTMKLTLANSNHASHISKFYRETHDDDFPHTEMFSENTVGRMIRDNDLAVIIASDASKILGCGVAFPSEWNQSFEIGSLSVQPSDRRVQVGRALFEALRRLGAKRYGVTYFRANSEMTFRRARKIGAKCWGYRILPNAQDADDAELLMGFFDHQKEAARIDPPDNDITRLPFAARIVETLHGETGVVPYPKNYPVGSPRGTGAPMDLGRIWPTFHAAGNFVTIESSTGPAPTDVIEAFVSKVRKKGVDDIRLFLPVNQVDAYFDLMELDFTATAYLPGWYLRANQRFDCLEMTAGAPPIPRNPDTFVERATKKISKDLTPLG